MSAENRKELAYELYKTLGEKRSYAKVAEIMGLSPKTIGGWGEKGKWQERLDKEYGEQVEQLQAKRDELYLLGIDTAISAIKLIKDRIDKGKLGKETAQEYELFLRTPLEVIAGTASGHSLSASDKELDTGEDKEIKIVFDVNGGVSSED